MLTQSDVVPLFYRLPTENIVEFKFLLESYEGLAEVRTLDAERGDVVALAVSDTAETVANIVQSFAERLEVREREAPENLEGDWLLAEWAEQRR